MSFLQPTTTSTLLQTTPIIAETIVTVVAGPYATSMETPEPYITVIGVPGPKGDPGASFNFTQSLASASWHVNHGLNKYPSVTVLDSSNDLVDCDIVYIDYNNLTINAEYPFTGTAYII